jgi:hypothetical protein
MHEHRKCPFMARRYGMCCMYGPNYVNLGRGFALRLFSVLIPHYTALPPARSGPSWSHPAMPSATTSIRPALTHTLQHPLLATQTSAVRGNHDMSRLPTPTYLNDVPIHGLACRYAPGLLPTDIGCGTLALAPRSRRGTATPAARDPNLGSGNHDMPRLYTPAHLNDVPIHGLPDLSLAYCQRILGVVPWPSHPEQTHTTPQLGYTNTTTATKLSGYRHAFTPKARF